MKNGPDGKVSSIYLSMIPKGSRSNILSATIMQQSIVAVVDGSVMINR